MREGEAQHQINSAVDDNKLKSQLRKQIKFHKHVTNAQGPKQLLQYSSNGEQFDDETLGNNLLEILKSNYSKPVKIKIQCS